jgi:antitoxin (DNA-binding transcriptional repressor) of toxin-antitoxin stability system
MTLHMSDSEIAANFAAALEKVKQGVEMIIERDHQPVAVLKAPGPPRRTISQILALLPIDSTGVMDPEFARDIEAAIESHREPLDSSKWD